VPPDPLGLAERPAEHGQADPVAEADGQPGDQHRSTGPPGVRHPDDHRGGDRTQVVREQRDQPGGRGARRPGGELHHPEPVRPLVEQLRILQHGHPRAGERVGHQPVPDLVVDPPAEPVAEVRLDWQQQLDGEEDRRRRDQVTAQVTPLRGVHTALHRGRYAGDHPGRGQHERDRQQPGDELAERRAADQGGTGAGQQPDDVAAQPPSFGHPPDELVPDGTIRVVVGHDHPRDRSKLRPYRKALPGRRPISCRSPDEPVG
jgi:hypothetical protein